MYHPEKSAALPGPLRAFPAICAGSANGACQRVFFFVGNDFVGIDNPRTEAAVEVGWQDGTTAALLYPQYRRGDAMCCPSGVKVMVRFHWDGSKLETLDRMPEPINGGM